MTKVFSTLLFVVLLVSILFSLFLLHFWIQQAPPKTTKEALNYSSGVIMRSECYSEYTNENIYKLSLSMNKNISSIIPLIVPRGVFLENETINGRNALITLLITCDRSCEKRFDLKVVDDNHREQIIPIILYIDKGTPFFKSDAIIIKFVNETRVRIWEWSIRYEHDINFRVFIIPALKDFRLLKDYLELELYVNEIIPRNSTWWPYQRNLGPYILNKTLDEVVKVYDYGDFKIVNVTEWPLFVKGVTIAYEGLIDHLSDKSIYTYNFIFGVLEEPTIYILLPKDMELISMNIGDKALEYSSCIYASNDYKCYLAKFYGILCGPSTLTLTIRIL